MFVCLFGWLFSYLFVWLVGWLAVCLVVVQLFVLLVCWLVVWLVLCLCSCLVDRLIVCSADGFRPFREIHSYEDVTITGEGVQILTYTWNSWSLSREGSLACHTFCDKGRPFRWSSPWTRDIYTYNCAFDSGTVTTVLKTTEVFRKRGSNPDLR